MKRAFGTLLMWMLASAAAWADGAACLGPQFPHPAVPLGYDTVFGADQQALEPEKLSPIARRLQQRKENVAANYDAVGEEVTCMPTSRNQRSRVLAEDKVFFTLRGRGYMATLTPGCRRLAIEDRFQMNIYGGRVCTGQILTVLDPYGREFGSCSIETLETYRRKPAAERTAAQDPE